MHFYELICGGGTQDYVTDGESLVLAELGGSYEWLKDVEMEDVEDSKDSEAPLPAECSVVTVRQSLEFKREYEGTSRNDFATKFVVKLQSLDFLKPCFEILDYGLPKKSETV
jgi:hypothetical protein